MLKKMFLKYKGYICNEAGFAAIILAFMLPVLVSSAGIAVDMSVAYNAQSRLSNALDKAVLAAASSNSSGLTGDQLQARFMAFFNANYPSGKYGTPFNVSLTINGSVMTATASAAVPTTFMSIVGITNLNVTATSQVVQTLAGVEAVLVLDTTGSMAGNNIAALQLAATNFINIMFNAIQNVQYIKIGIVPWSDTVNVGPYGYILAPTPTGQTPNGQPYGTAFVSPPTSDAYNPTASTINYTTNMNSTDWGGCVMEPNAAAITQDYTGVNWKMYRYPPPSNNSCHIQNCINNAYNCAAQTCSQYNCRTYQCQTYACARFNCNSCCPTGNVMNSDNATCCPSGDVLTNGSCCPSGDVDSSGSCCPSGDVVSSGHCCPSGYSYSSNKCVKGSTKVSATSVVTAVTAPSVTTPNSSGQCTGADSVCTGYGSTCEQNGTCSAYSSTCQTYYTSSNQCASWACTTPGTSPLNGCSIGPDNSSCYEYNTSPNSGCTTVPVLPMTNNQAALLAEINALPTANNTYPDIGMAWGWRLISPGFPFQEGASYSDNTWSKTVIMMTDGNATINTVANGEGYYGSNFYGATSGISQTTTDQNNKFEQICTNMKAVGIRIYTITFQSAINATTQQYYSECATNPSMYYNAPTNADLTTAFQQIATQLSQLHLTQ